MDILSGPDGLAARPRSALVDPRLGFGRSHLPLDVGAGEPTVRAHLRRAVIPRDRHGVFPGCRQPPATCQVHHLLAAPTTGPSPCRTWRLSAGA